MSYTLVSWNVNGYKPDIHSWLKLFIEVNNPDVIFLSETKKSVEDLQPLFSEFINYNVIYNVHIPKQWHGVCMLIRKDRSYEQFEVNMEINPRSDCKGTNPICGRLISVCIDKKFYLVGTYTPNSGRGEPMKYKDYRLNKWDKSFFEILNIIKSNGPTIWMGDINVAPNEIDVSSPKTMCKWAGFTPEERSSFNGFISSGEWIDIWRKQHHNVREFSWRGNGSIPNFGLRLDNVIISKGIEDKVTNSFMVHSCNKSDHIPVGIQLNM
jgi:exodeoxyribonuclease III